MKKLRSSILTIMGWIVGVFLLLIGIMAVFDGILGGLFFILAGFIITPKLYKIFKQIFKKELSIKHRVGIGVIVFMFGLILFNISSPTNKDGNLLDKPQEKIKDENPEEVLENYFKYLNFKGYEERLNNMQYHKQVSDSIILKRIENNEYYWEQRKILNQNWEILCREAKDLGVNVDMCQILPLIEEQKSMEMEMKILSKKVIEDNEESKKIQVNYKIISKTGGDISESVDNVTYILKKNNGWKIFDMINSSGHILSRNYDAEKIKKDMENSINREKDFYQDIKNQLDEIKKIPKKNYLSESLQDILFKFTSSQSTLTDLQKKEKWNGQYKGKYVKGVAYVYDVDQNMFGKYTILADFKPRGQYDFSSDLAIFFKSTEKDKLLKISKGTKIGFEGILSDYHELMGNLDIIEATLLDEVTIEEIEENTQNTDYNKDELIASCIASGIPADSCRNAINQER